MRTRKAPELAAGELHQLLLALAQRTGAQVIVHLGEDVDEVVRQHMLNDFIAGRAHLLFYLQTKLSYVLQFPFRLAAIAHRNVDVVRETLAACLSLEAPTHPLLQALHSAPLNELARRYIEGEDGLLFTPDFEALCRFMGTFRFAPLSDRTIESQHAKVSKFGKPRPSHTQQLQSYMLRRGEIEQVITSRPASLGEFAFCVSRCRNHLAAMNAVGLGNHPILLRKRTEERR
eukprot:6483846-Amphidinium_carterae.1